MADFDDFDDFDFKPVTKGLGFHHGDKKEVKKFNRTSALEKNSERRRSSVDSQKTVNSNSSSISKNDLSSFYQTSTEPSTTASSIAVSALNQGAEAKVFADKAPLYVRILAWAFDLCIVVTLLAITLAGFFILLGKDISQIKTMLTIHEFAVFGGIFFSVFYIAYFSVLDLNGSLGKSLFGLTVVSEEGSVSLNQTLIRSIITLGSFVLFFLPELFDLQGKVTHTRVVRK